MSRLRDQSAYAYSLFAKSRPAPRPVQRIPAYQPPMDPQQVARSAYFSDMLRDGWDDEDAHELTVERFAIADHKLLGAIRNEE